MNSGVCTDQDLLTILGYVKLAYLILQIAVPIVLLIMGTVDLLKAVTSGDEKEIKAATAMLGKRAGAALGVFLLFIIIRLLTRIVGGTEWTKCWDAAGTASVTGSGPVEPVPPSLDDDPDE